MANSTCRIQLAFTAIIAGAFLFAVQMQAAAQSKFKVGDKVEIKSYDYFDDWYKAEVLEVRSDGRYKIRYEGGVVDTVEASKMRLPGNAAPPPDDGNKNKGGVSNKDQPAGSANKAIKFKPGDRVECDKAQIGRWEKGTVVHFRPNDLDKESGRYYRVKLDNFKTYYPEGHECYAGFIRPVGKPEPPLKATGKYKVGDRVEAHDHSGAWLPAKITAIEGAFYKVSFEGYDSRHDQMVDEERIRLPLGTAANEDQNRRNDTEPEPAEPPAGAAKKLPGTAWKVSFYNKGETPPAGPKGVPMLMLFCPDGRWDNVRYGLRPGAAGAVGMRGRYSVAGNQLTTTADTGKKGVYRMTWVEGGKILDLDGGSGLIMRLFYSSETQCK